MYCLKAAEFVCSDSPELLRRRSGSASVSRLCAKRGEWGVGGGEMTATVVVQKLAVLLSESNRWRGATGELRRLLLRLMLAWALFRRLTGGA